MHQHSHFHCRTNLGANSCTRPARCRGRQAGLAGPEPMLYLAVFVAGVEIAVVRFGPQVLHALHGVWLLAAAASLPVIGLVVAALSMHPDRKALSGKLLCLLALVLMVAGLLAVWAGARA